MPTPLAVPLVINARVDALRRGETFDEAIDAGERLPRRRRGRGVRAGLDTSELVERAVAEIDGPVSVIAKAGYLPIAQLADLGVARVSFGPGPQALSLHHLTAAAEVLTARGEYPAELRF